MLAVEILKLLDQRGVLEDIEIANSLSSFGLLEENQSAMHPSLRHPRYRVSTVSLDEVRNVVRVLSQLNLVTNGTVEKRRGYELTKLGKKLLLEMKE